MAVIQTNLTCDLQEPVKVRYLDGNLFSQDNQSNQINVAVVDGGEPVAISGSVTANVIRADGGTVAVSGGTISENVASITMPSAAYAVPGVVSIVIKLTTSGVITTIGAVVANVYQSSTETAIDPGTIIPSVTALISAIETAVASIPADYSSLWTTLAPAFNPSKSGGYSVGEYCTNDGKMYICINPHTGSWTAGDFTQVNIGSELSALKSAFDIDEQYITDAFKGSFRLPVSWEVGTYSSTNRTQKVDNSNYIRSYQVQFSIPGKFTYITLPSNITFYVIDITANSSITMTASAYKELDPTHKYQFVAKHSNNTAFTDASEGANIKVEFLTDFLHIGQCVTPSNYSSILSDANNAPANSTYRIYFTTGTTSYPANLPNITKEIAEGDMFGVLDTISQKASTSFTFQIFRTKYSTFTRYKTTTSWTAWIPYNSRLLSIRTSYFTASTAQTILPDLDSAEDNTVYIGYLTANPTYPAHLPTAISSTSIVYVLTFGDGTYKVQQFENRGRIWFRNKVSSTWTPWFTLEDYLPSTYEVDSSYTDGAIKTVGNKNIICYSSLAKAIEQAVVNPDSVVYVNAGEYDILSEYQALHPSDWASRNDGRGINLNNWIHLIFDSKSKVVCHYEGSTESVMTNFSAFNVRYGSATIENATIEASNVRYCVHDDMWTSGTPYHVLYKDCVMKIDNSGNPYRSKYPHCIGGGFGQDGHIVVQNCVFTGVGGDGTTNPAPDDDSIVSWHNGPNEHQLSHLTITGCYFNGTGSFRAMSNGTATEESIIMVCNNSLGSEITEGFVDGASVDNMKVIAFNNEIRNA